MTRAMKTTAVEWKTLFSHNGPSISHNLMNQTTMYVSKLKIKNLRDVKTSVNLVQAQKTILLRSRGCGNLFDFFDI